MEETPEERRRLDSGQSLPLLSNKQGTVWILEPEKVPKIGTNESPPRGAEVQKNKDTVEVFPVKKYATIKGHSLILSAVDGSQVTIDLQNCTVVAVSASNLSSRKWAKRYPLRLESKNSLLYNGSKICYLYLDTSWEKESWCKALRLASCLDKEKLIWYARLTEEFRNYLASLNAEYPLFLKPSVVLVEDLEATDRSNRTDGSSRVRLLLKKLAKKTSKNNIESKTSVSTSTRSERKTGEKMHHSQDTSLTDGSSKSFMESNSSSKSLQDLLRRTSNHSGNKNQHPFFSDDIFNEKFTEDEGTLCWNLLLSRLFFDVKRNNEMNNAVLARIQRALLNMRTPNYIRGVTCSGIDLGNLAPYIHNLRVLPMDLNEVWAVEVDFEYSGGILLDFETRIEVSEPGLQEDIINTSFESSSAEELTSDLLEGFEHYENQLRSTHSANTMENRGEEDKLDVLKQSKSSSWKASYVSRWKAIKKSFADQVSQVPLSLAVRVASLRGTLRLHIKPPPSDRIWYGFTSMPEIDWKLESSIGDRKITNAHIALIIGNRFKTAIRDTVVLPNCESICIPFMLAEKDDWVPRTAAPFMWLNQDVSDKAGSDSSGSHHGEAISKPGESLPNKVGLDNKDKPKKTTQVQEHNREPVSEGSLAPAPPNQSLEDLAVALIKSAETQEICSDSKVESARGSTSRSLVTREELPTVPPEDDLKSVKAGSRRARMLDLGKKMGEKLEEKRRHIEEKSRNIVEKMRENTKN